MGLPPANVLDPPNAQCPFCARVLAEPDDRDWIDSDAAGAFVMCRGCNQRVALDPVPSPQGAPRFFRVAKKQAPRT